MATIQNTLLSNSDVQHEIDLDIKTIVNNYNQFYQYPAARHFEGLDKISIYKCTKTGFRFYYPLSIEGDENFYIDLYTKHAASLYSKDKWEFQRALTFVNENDRILDIGCGAGDFLMNVKKSKSTNVFGLEKSAFAIQNLKKNNIGFFTESLPALAAKGTEKFDVVSAFQVLEHVGQPGEFLKQAISLLKPGGKLIIGVPHSNPFLYGSDVYHTLNLPPHHMGLWSQAALNNVANHFDVRLLDNTLEPMDNVAFYLACRLGIQHWYQRVYQNAFGYYVVKTIKTIMQLFQSFFPGRGQLAIFIKK
jgi:2-polyprenyl-3-methyl-5-hydroxy-6-metoxy-1,4-benzoquinol methylase